MGFFDAMGREYAASMDNAIRSAQVRTPGAITLPEGNYQMYVAKVALKEGNTPDSYPNFLMQLTLLAGEYGGSSVYKWYSLEPDETRMSILKTDLARLGMNLETILDLENEEKLTKLLDQIVEVQVKDKKAKNGKTYQQYYINRVVGYMGNAPGSELDDDGLPWAN